MSNNRRGTSPIGKQFTEKLKPRKFSRFETLKYLMRCWKRELIAKGDILTGDDAPKKWRFVYELGDQRGVVEAQSQIEARIQIKKELGIGKNKRIPIRLKIKKFPNTVPSAIPEKEVE